MDQITQEIVTRNLASYTAEELLSWETRLGLRVNASPRFSAEAEDDMLEAVGA